MKATDLKFLGAVKEDIMTNFYKRVDSDIYSGCYDDEFLTERLFHMFLMLQN